MKKHRQKTYLWTCAPREDWDQLAHSRSLIRFIIERFLNIQGCKVFWHQRQAYLGHRLTYISEVMFSNIEAHLVLNAWKGPLCSLRASKALISLRNCAGWSGPCCPLTESNTVVESMDTVVYVDHHRILRLNCTDAHADLDLHCLQMASEPFSCVAHNWPARESRRSLNKLWIFIYGEELD